MRPLGHAGGDVDGDAADIVTHHLDLAGVHASANFEIERPHHPTISWAQRTARAGPSNSARKPSPRGFHFATAMPLQFCAHRRVMRFQS